MRGMEAYSPAGSRVRLTPQYCRDADVIMGTESNTVTGAIWTRPPEFTARQVNRKPGPKHSVRLTWVQQPTLPAWEATTTVLSAILGAGQGAALDPIHPFGTLSSRTGLRRERCAQDLLFCAFALIADVQSAENLFMSTPALTQSCIS